MSALALFAAAALQLVAPPPVAGSSQLPSQLQSQLPSQPPAVSSVTAPPPLAAWVALPELRYRRRLPQPDAVATFVRAEVAAQRCTVPAEALALPVDLILFVDHTGLVRRVVPRAIDCATVEQYAAGLVLRMARDNLLLTGGAVDAWYRTRIVFPLK